MPRILLILDAVFSVLMLVDAIRRGARGHWYMVILMPFGEWVYFFMVKIHDPEFDGVRRLWRRLTEKRVTVEQIRYQYSQTPSLANQVRLAQALHDEGSYGESVELFKGALNEHGAQSEVLYGLALAQTKLEHYGAATENLRRLIAMDPSYDDYAPWKDLAEALIRKGDNAEALAVLEELVRASPRFYHRVLLAHYLMDSHRYREAEEQLRHGLLSYRAAPKFLRRRESPVARMAKRMLRSIEATAQEAVQK